MKIWKNGYAKNEVEEAITHSISDVIKILFGNDYKESDIDTFEKCFDIIKNDKNFKYKLLSENILKECAKSLKEKEGRLEFPSELKKYI